MHSANESSHHPQTRVKCPHVFTFSGPRSVVVLELSDAGGHHVRELWGVERNIPLPVVLRSRHPPVPVHITDLPTVRPLLRL
jgi:hypothetical protein